MNLDALTIALARDEGRKVNARGRHMPYICPAGKQTLGYGRNIQDNGISETEALDLLNTDAIQALRDAASLVPNWGALNDVRANVVANMAFNMGRATLAKFVKFLAAVNDRRWTDAAYEMEMSRWYTQVGGRSVRLKHEMLTGVAEK